MPAVFQPAPLYRLVDNAFWPSLARQQPIPATLQSSKATSGRSSHVGLGIVKAVCAVLTAGWLSGMAVDQQLSQPLRWTLQVNSGSTYGMVHTIGGDAATWWIENKGYLEALAWLVDALTVCRHDPIGTEFRQRWHRFLRLMEHEIGASPPYTSAVLCQVAQPSPASQTSGQTSRQLSGGTRLSTCTQGMMGVTDALYFYAKERYAGSALAQVEELPDPSPLVAQPGTIEQWLYLQQSAGVRQTQAPFASGVASPPTFQASAPPVAPSRLRPVATGLMPMLRRLIARGGTGLLVGQSGHGKSSAVRLAAIEAGTWLVRITGWPTMTDRELFGKVNPIAGPNGEQLHAWVDGPLASAWRAVQAGERVLLLIDELARFDPLYLAPLMGALDTVRGEELALVIGLGPAVRASLQPNVTYRLLDMPNGEHMVAPADRLTVVATANLGTDYVQTQQEFDAGLLRRFEVTLDVHRQDSATRKHILMRAHGVPVAVADILVAAEDYSTHETGAQGGLLRRELNLGTCVNWAIEALDLHAAGLPWPPALLAAAEVTAIPYICARDPTGFIDRPAADSVNDWLRQIIDAAPLSAA